MKEIKKYCSCIDCLACDEAEPCIYRIANNLQEQLKRKEQECEKLYIQLKTDEEYHKEEENTLRKIIKNKEERNTKLYKENKKYKQALDEIEKQVKAMNNECFYDDICDCDNCDMKNGCSYYRKFKILNIINKVKE